MRHLKIFLFIIVVSIFASCSHKESEKRSMYYWRTSLNLSKGERAFLQQHHVGRLYVRYFDVVCDDAGHSQPNATLSFDDSLPAGLEIVPTVYILNDCMRHDDPLLAERILKRVRQMNETNDVGPLKELQVDCDWTMQTRQRFFGFLKQLHALCQKNNVRLSATIRLHQLSQPAPPVDRGVLMVYNTGDVTRLDCEKPIQPRRREALRSSSRRLPFAALSSLSSLHVARAVSWRPLRGHHARRRRPARIARRQHRHPSTFLARHS